VSRRSGEAFLGSKVQTGGGGVDWGMVVVVVDILNEKYWIFCPEQIFKLPGQIDRNSINNCDFLKFLISVRGSHCYLSPPGVQNPVTPLGGM
jgi:hypothetical protein